MEYKTSDKTLFMVIIAINVLVLGFVFFMLKGENEYQKNMLEMSSEIRDSNNCMAWPDDPACYISNNNN